MKKLLFMLLIASILLLSACNSIEENDASESQTGLVKSNLSRETSPQADSDQIAALADDDADFALLFYDQIRKGDDNIIFSPISLSLALSMTLAGAEDSTQEAMMEALQLTLPEDEVHPAFNALLLAIEESENKINEESEGTNFTINIANSIWGQAGFDFKPAFLDTLALNYGAGVYNVDYIQYPEEARTAINDWVEEETEDKIQDLIPKGAINSLTRLVLANAIYFNGSWLHPFSDSTTAKAPFTLLDDSQVTVDMMSLAGESYYYTQGDKYQVVQLPYLSSDFAMTLIVPDSGTYAQFEENFSSEELESILVSLSYESVDLQMPKFDFESSIDAKSALQALGMSEAFNADSANFYGMTEEEALFITDVLHKATIAVDEKGTEAAAATAVIMGMKSAPPGEAISLVIDRPFLFLIQHLPTGSILFMGRVTQP